MQVIAEPIPRRADQPAEHSARPIALEPPSVVVLTKDEEVNIEACLQTLSFSDDIVVLDSYSTDRTVEMARRHPNVRVVQRHFDTEWKQRNYGLQDIPYKHPWVYICDADERVPQGLVDEMMQKINTPSLPYMAFRLRYKNMYLGKWIKHASGYPVWLIRLVRPEYVSYEVR
jgi:glycosyltransferase involved in cell wall biosynthesis